MLGHISIYKESAVKISWDLEMIMIIRWFTRMFILIENIRNLGPLQSSSQLNGR